VNAGVTPLQTVLISAGGAITVALQGLLGGLLPERFKRTAPDRRWLLERRHEEYVALIASSNDLLTKALSAAKRPTAANIEAFAESAEESYRQLWSIELVGSPHAKLLAGHIAEAAHELMRTLPSKDCASPDYGRLSLALVAFTNVLSVELASERWWWQRRCRAKEAKEAVARMSAFAATAAAEPTAKCGPRRAARDEGDEQDDERKDREVV